MPIGYELRFIASESIISRSLITRFPLMLFSASEIVCLELQMVSKTIPFSSSTITG